MNPRRARRRIPLALVFAGAASGSLAALSLGAWLWGAAHPGAPIGDLLFAMTVAPLPWVLGGLAGALAGVIVSRAMLRSTFGRRILAPFLGLVLVLAGGALGGALGVVAYGVFSLVHDAEAGVPEAIDAVGHSFLDPTSAIWAFIVIGALIGMAVAAAASPEPTIGNAYRRLVGALIGAVAGVVVFSFGYVLRYYRDEIATSAVSFRFAEAIFSLTPVEFLFAGLGAAVGFATALYSWRLYGVFTLIALVATVAGYVTYTLTVTLPLVPEADLPFSLVLFVAETGSLTMVVLYSFYTLDVATRKRWRRVPEDAHFSRYYLPKVVFQMPTFNEPPELVLASLRTLLAVDYPEDRFLVIVADDSTKPECSAPLRAFCESHGILYQHREDRTGYKAGALNLAMSLVPADVDLIAIVDADYQVAPEYLRETVGFFADPSIGWVQTPQDYRNRHQSFLTEQYYLADSYFYRTVLPSRNEENSIIFCGTMGILRRAALERAGGWGEEYITEDAELSVRLAQLGYGSLYVNKTYGRGLIPATFDGYKKQHYRWAFGGSRILRSYFFRLVFGRFTPRQALDHIVGTVHWFEGLFILVIAGAILGLAWGELLGFRFVVHHQGEVLLVGLVPLLLLTDGLTRLHMVMRRGMGLSMRETLRVLGMWMSVKFSNSFAALKAFVGFRIPFVRTPKAPDHRVGRGEALSRALRVAKFETLLAVVFAVTTVAIGWTQWGSAAPERPVSGALLALWLTYYTLVFAAAPVYAYRSYVTFRPDSELRAEAAVPKGAIAQ